MSLKETQMLNLQPNCDPSILQKQKSSKRVTDGGKTKCMGTCKFRLPKRCESLPIRYLQHIGRKVSIAMRFLFIRKRGSYKEGVSSSGRGKTFVSPIDSHRAEAIDDCIEFINSSSSLQKSDSVKS